MQHTTYSIENIVHQYICTYIRTYNVLYMLHMYMHHQSMVYKHFPYFDVLLEFANALVRISLSLKRTTPLSS